MRAGEQLPRVKGALRGFMEGEIMAMFLLWLLLFILCWPLALLVVILYPIVWLALLPFRLLGIAVDAVFDLLKAILRLPARLLGGPRSV